MKCRNCNQDIVIHDNIIKKQNKPITMNELEFRGLIYNKEGLREYSNNENCQICNDTIKLDEKQLKSYRKRLILNETLTKDDFHVYSSRIG